MSEKTSEYRGPMVDKDILTLMEDLLESIRKLATLPREADEAGDLALSISRQNRDLYEALYSYLEQGWLQVEEHPVKRAS